MPLPPEFGMEILRLVPYACTGFALVFFALLPGIIRRSHQKQNDFAQRVRQSAMTEGGPTSSSRALRRFYKKLNK